MAFKKYQVSFNEDGSIEACLELPDEPPRKRTIVVREETSRKAQRVASDLYSLAK
jgi:hypothetical protein